MRFPTGRAEKNVSATRIPMIGRAETGEEPDPEPTVTAGECAGGTLNTPPRMRIGEAPRQAPGRFVVQPQAAKLWTTTRAISKMFCYKPAWLGGWILPASARARGQRWGIW